MVHCFIGGEKYSLKRKEEMVNKVLLCGSQSKENERNARIICGPTIEK